MSNGTGVEGLNKVVLELNRAIEQIANRSEAGLYEGAMLIKAAAMKKTPVDTGNLRKSAYIDRVSRIGAGQSSKFMPVVFIGYSAVYALYVHENVEQRWKGRKRISGTKKGHYWDSGEPKFLEKAIIEKRKAVIDQIKRRAGA